MECCLRYESTMLTHGCPKCRGLDILHITELSDRVGEVGGACRTGDDLESLDAGPTVPWRLARIDNPDDTFFAPNLASVGHVQALVCRQCGHTEFVTKGAESIPIDGKIVKLIRVRSDGPYR